MNNKTWIFTILLLGFLLRIVFITQYPVGFTADEASQAYDAYSILKTGKDGWGEFMPLFPRSLGDFKAPLYMYLTVPSVAVFGLNEFAARFPAVVIGTLTIIIVYFLAHAIFDRKTALISAILIAISPWHIQLSRVAFEGGIGVFLFSLCILLFFTGVKHQPKLIPLSFLLLGLTTYSYHSWRLFSLLLAPFMFLVLLRIKLQLKLKILSVVLFALVLLPTLMNLDLILKRADVSVFSESNINSYFANKGSTPINPKLARLFDNKYRFIWSQFTNNYLSYFSPYFLFSTARPDNSYLNFPRTPLHYPLEILFISVGIFYLTIHRNPYFKWLALWALLGPIPPALTESFNANRGITMLPLTILLSGYGASKVNDIFPKFKHPKLNVLFPLILFVSFILFVYDLFYKLPYNPIFNQRVGYREAFQHAISLESQYDSIHFSKFYTNPQIFIAFYKTWDPRNYQIQSQDWLRYEKAGINYVDQLESYNLGKYEIHDIDWNRDKNRQGKILFISNEINFPADIYSIWDYTDTKGNSLFKFVPLPQPKDF